MGQTAPQDALNPQNFCSRHDEVLESDDLLKKVDWARRSIRPDGEHRRCYRIYAKDLDGDLVKLAPAVLNHFSSNRQQAAYYLRLTWRFMMRRYALIPACRLEPYLRCSKLQEPGGWFLWRILAGYSMPRLWAAIIIGFAAVFGSDAASASIAALAGKPGLRGLVLAILIVLAFFVTTLDVQRRIGRRCRDMFVRSLIVSGFGIFYAASGIALVCWVNVIAGWPQQPWRLILSASAALFLAHVLQLFWQESSAAEPM